jgi:putative ABC transport system substrate-binding protein
MRRREFIGLLGGAAATWPLASRAQQPERLPRVSVLLGIPENDPETNYRLRAFRLGMRDAGWIEGRNVHIDYRYAGADRDSIKKHVAEVIRSAPDDILANSTPVMAALRPATNTIPIVFVAVNYPVGQGFIPNLAHPGGNVTGFSFIEPEIVGKWINLLGEVKPDLSWVALMHNPDTAPYYDEYFRSFKALPQQSRMELDATPVRSPADIERAIAELARNQHAGLIVAADIYIIAMRGVA